MKIKNLLFILILIAFSSTVSFGQQKDSSKKIEVLRSPASIDDDTCLDAILKIIHASEKKVIPKVVKPFRYPKEFLNQAQKHIQYGFEVEYTMDEAKVIFNNFMPASPIYQGTREEWLKMSYYDQLMFFDKNYQRIYSQGARKPGRMVKITQGAMAKYISDDLICDSGNFELVYKPFDSMEDLFETIKNSKRLLGPGSMQVMISSPLDKEAFRNNEKLFKKKFEEELGYYNFVNEMDTLEKLVSGYHRYRTNPKIYAAASFNHPWLGPMTRLKNIRLKKFLELTYLDDPRLKREMRDYAYQVTSNKFVGGLAFRPDVAYMQGRVASEIRDCHKNLNCLESRVKRETLFLMNGKKNFQKYAKMDAFDTMVVPYNINPKIFEMLKELFPAFNNMDVAHLELYRNFTYPLRSWSTHLSLLKKPELAKTVEMAQEQYINKLLKISQQYTTKTINRAEARREVMGALVEFAYDSKLYEAFKSELNKMMKHNNFKVLEGINLSYAPLDKSYKPAFLAVA